MYRLPFLKIHEYWHGYRRFFGGKWRQSHGKKFGEPLAPSTPVVINKIWWPRKLESISFALFACPAVLSRRSTAKPEALSSTNARRRAVSAVSDTQPVAVLASTRQYTSFTPAFFSALAHSLNVLPVVATSSMRRTDLSFRLACPTTPKALRTFFLLSSLVRVV